MLCKRELLAKYSNLLPSKNENQAAQEDSQIPFFRLFHQGKMISQIIAYIWRYGDKHTPKGYAARTLSGYFENPGDNGANIKKLWQAIPNRNGSLEDQLLYAVFPMEGENYPDGYFFPIFNSSERTYYSFITDVNNFQGVIEDANVNTPELMRLTTPFPPRPQLGKLTVTKRELEEWINNREPRDVIAKNPYIPTCTS
ncbi:MAG: hypothetical protein F6J86_18620 [Symploca sp. SIO1B1]|nr:hypothetical protein [Symploca sp. SIO1B1]